MSLSRAFTVSTKRARKTSDGDVSTIPVPQRSSTTKQSFSGAGNIREKKISAPIELISTTNMLSYNAPDIYPRGRSSTTSSANSNSDGRSVISDSDTAPSSVGTPLTSPEVSSVESSPTTSSPPLPNHLSCYFGQSVAPVIEAPMIPTRALSHTKKSSEVLSKKRSMSRMSPKNSISNSKTPIPPIPSPAPSANMFTMGSDVDKHPFGKELAQVSELAEEYNSAKAKRVADEEERELVTKGLFKFQAEDYMSELQGLFHNIFGDKPQVSAPMWI